MPEYILNGMPWKRGSEMSSSFEGGEMGKNLNRCDSKRYSLKVAALFREDLIFRSNFKILIFFLV